jgi:hypothetical protein
MNWGSVLETYSLSESIDSLLLWKPKVNVHVGQEPTTGPYP